MKTTQPSVSPLSLQPVNKPQNLTVIIILLYVYIHHLSRRTCVCYISVTMELSNLTQSLILIQGKSNIWNTVSVQLYAFDKNALRKKWSKQSYSMWSIVCDKHYFFFKEKGKKNVIRNCQMSQLSTLYTNKKCTIDIK